MIDIDKQKTSGFKGQPVNTCSNCRFKIDVDDLPPMRCTNEESGVDGVTEFCICGLHEAV